MAVGGAFVESLPATAICGSLAVTTPPPARTWAPSSRPTLRYFWIFSYWSFDACAPTIVSESSGLPTLIAFTRSTSRSIKASAIDSWTRMRDGQVQTSPWLRANMAAPSRHLSKKASSSSMTDSKKTFGDLPPSSSVIGMMFSLAYCMMRRPVVVSPVNAIFLIPSCWASGLPASGPNPWTTLRTPAGISSLMRSSHSMIETGVCSAGLRTTQLPAASAGASFHAAMRSGKFHGMIWPTTPSGSWRLIDTVVSSSSEMPPSCARMTDAK